MQLLPGFRIMSFPNKRWKDTGNVSSMSRAKDTNEVMKNKHFCECVGCCNVI